MKKNISGTMINQTVTIVEKAGAEIADVRNLIMAYDDNGDVVPAENGEAPLLGIAIIEAGINDITGTDSGKVAKDDDVDIQIKDIGYVLADGNIAKGAEVTAKDGLATTADAGDYVLGIALDSAKKDDYCRVQIAKYQKSSATA